MPYLLVVTMGRIIVVYIVNSMTKYIKLRSSSKELNLFNPYNVSPRTKDFVRSGETCGANAQTIWSKQPLGFGFTVHGSFLPIRRVKS